MLVAGCKPPPVSSILTQRCAAAPERQVAQTVPIAVLDIDRAAIGTRGVPRIEYGWENQLRINAKRGQQPCWGCIELLLTKGYQAVEYRLGIAGGYWAADDAPVGFHALAAAGDPRCAWSAGLPSRRAAWLTSQVPAGRCVTMESGPRRGTVRIEQRSEVVAEAPDSVSRNWIRAVHSRTGELIAQAAGYSQMRGDLGYLHCTDLQERDNLDLVLESLPPIRR